MRMKSEIWIPVLGFENMYQVSNYGKVKSLEREIDNKWGKTHLLKGRILKPQIDKYGYLYVNLYKDKKNYHKTIHRLVATAFIPNPDNLPCVNHRDENPKNNFVENLEWCDNAYNLNYGGRKERAAKSRLKPVYQYDLEGNLVKKWNSLKEIPYNNGNISMCCNGKIKTAYGFLWRYAV